MDVRKEETHDNPAHSHAHMEPSLSDGIPSEEGRPTFDTRVRIHFTHYRKRLCDPDGMSVKAAIDALVQGNLLSDDSAQQIAEITHTQVQDAEERTVIEIEEV